jgi:glycosyltransferase involved in cell wall biosynthesis
LKEELLSNALFFVTPSRLEGLPIALLEAMAHGQCCLASNIPPHQEIIQTGQDGLLFQWNDPDQLDYSLQGLLARSDSFRTDLGSWAKHKVRHHYSWDIVTDAVEYLYASLLDPGHLER